MAQSSFADQIRLLFFGVTMQSDSAESVLYELNQKSTLQPLGKNRETFSLGTGMILQSKNELKKQSFNFIILQPPIPNLSFDSGYLRLTIAQSSTKKKIVDLQWCLETSNEIDAKNCYDTIVEFLLPYSSKHSFNPPSEQKGLLKYAALSSGNLSVSGIKNITLFIERSRNGEKYQIRILPFNEFSTTE